MALPHLQSIPIGLKSASRRYLRLLSHDQLEGTKITKFAHISINQRPKPVAE